MRYSASEYILCACCLMLAFTSCRSSAETTVVRQTPDTPADTAAADTADEDFSQIVIGELEPVSSLDPLHARNAATMRTLQLVYEGLVRYAADGTLEPLLAREWEVEEDSTLYRFSLRRDAFYHDSNIFSSGVGRQLHAGDVKFAIERMAWNSVDPRLAEPFMNIVGFEPYFQEQHRVFNAELRRLEGISGIRAVNDSTIVFQLIEPDRDFPDKLASPHAMVYPHEALASPYPSRFRAVGTGPFSISRLQGDSLFIFSRFDDYRMDGEPRLNRVDVVVSGSESSLFRAFARGEIDLIPGIGPQTLETVTAEDGRLMEGYADEFELHRSEGRLHYALYHNASGPLSRSAAERLAGSADSALFDQDLPGLEYRMADAATDTSEAAASESEGQSATDTTDIDSVFTTYEDDPWLKTFATRWAERLGDRGIVLQMVPIRAPTRNIAFHTSSWMPVFRNDSVSHPSPPLLEFSIPAVALTRQRVRNFELNRYPWWFDLRNTEVADNPNASR